LDRWLDELARAAGGRITRRSVLGRVIPGAHGQRGALHGRPDGV
jgi:hypothetical protein